MDVISDSCKPTGMTEAKRKKKRKKEQSEIQKGEVSHYTDLLWQEYTTIMCGWVLTPGRASENG